MNHSGHPASAYNAKVQAQIAAAYGNAPQPPPKPVSSPIRQKAGPQLNKLELAFLERLKRTYPGFEPMAQAITLKLANGCRYTPDFVVVRFPEIKEEWATIDAYEVKGFMRDDANVKLKVAASLYPWIAFHLVQRKKGIWQITPVLP